MSQKKYKKRHPQKKRQVSAPAMESEFSSDGKRKRMNPAARNLMFVALICLAISEILFRMKFLSEVVSLVISIVALVLLVAAVYLQFRRPDGSSHGRPRL